MWIDELSTSENERVMGEHGQPNAGRVGETTATYVYMAKHSGIYT